MKSAFSFLAGIFALLGVQWLLAFQEQRVEREIAEPVQLSHPLQPEGYACIQQGVAGNMSAPKCARGVRK